MWEIFTKKTIQGKREEGTHQDRLVARHFPSSVDEGAQKRCYVCSHTAQRPKKSKELV